MQEYTLKDFKVSDFKDTFGNTWCDAIFEELGEPVKWVVKEPSSITLGIAYYGEIVEKTSKAGKPYNRFYKKEKPEEGVKKGYQPKDEKQITRNMVWKNLLGHFDVQSMEYDSEQWKIFWALVDLHTEMLLPKAVEAPVSVPEDKPVKPLRQWSKLAQKDSVVVDELFPDEES